VALEDAVSENWAFGGSPAPLDEAGTTTLIQGSSFLISRSNGDVHPGAAQGMFVRDTRFVSRWEVRVDGRHVEGLSVMRPEPFSATFVGRGAPPAGQADSTLLVLRHRTLSDGLHEVLELHNLGAETAARAVTLLVDADFADIFEVKENRVPVRTDTTTALPDAAGLRVHYRWMGRHRGVAVVADPRPSSTSAGVLEFKVVLPPREVWRVVLEAVPLGDVDGAHDRSGVDTAAAAERMAQWRRRRTLVTSANPALAATIASSEADLGALQIFDPAHPSRPVVAAGAPWFMTLFGRDSIIASWMALALDPRLALGTLQTLADHQGRVVDPVNEEQPGRILHEVRGGLAATEALGGGGVYYGTADATPLFVMLLGEVWRWGADRAVVDALLPAADRALEWIESYGDRDGDGFVEYQRLTDRGLLNQGWKDSWDSMTFADGRLAQPPIALCEVQGYVYAAYRARADLAQARGDDELAARCRDRAARLKRSFHEAFWLPDRGYYAMALDGDKRPVDALASNMGHCLWTGIVDESVAPAVADHLLSPELFSGWGVRTLATSMHAYNPLSYHNGSVWPHDSGIVAAGLMRYGLVERAQRVVAGLLDAAAAAGGRLPELFAGFDRKEFAVPVPYPTSCSPQAWSSATPVHLVRTLLRYEPDVPAGRLWVAPAVPAAMLPLRVDRLPVNGSEITLRVDEHGWDVEGLPAELQLVREPRPLPT
jgi:glycogen debranching enzyme